MRLDKKKTDYKALQRCKDSHIPIMEEWMVKLIELAEMANLTGLIIENTLFRHISTWELLLDFSIETEKKIILGFRDWI